MNPETSQEIPGNLRKLKVLHRGRQALPPVPVVNHNIRTLPTPYSYFLKVHNTTMLLSTPWSSNHGRQGLPAVPVVNHNIRTLPTPYSYFLKVHNTTMLPSTPWSSNPSLFFRFSIQHSNCICLFSYTCASHSVHLTLHNFISYLTL